MFIFHHHLPSKQSEKSHLAICFESYSMSPCAVAKSTSKIKDSPSIQGRTQDFLKGGGGDNFFLYNGQKSAKNQPYVSPLSYSRLPQSCHIAKSLKNKLQRCKSRNLTEETLKKIAFFQVRRGPAPSPPRCAPATSLSILPDLSSAATAWVNQQTRLNNLLA